MSEQKSHCKHGTKQKDFCQKCYKKTYWQLRQVLFEVLRAMPELRSWHNGSDVYQNPRRRREETEA